MLTRTLWHLALAPRLSAVSLRRGGWLREWPAAVFALHTHEAQSFSRVQPQDQGECYTPTLRGRVTRFT